jgi:hypothetical protein
LADRAGDNEGLTRALLTTIEEMRDGLLDDEKTELATRIRKLLI